MFSKTFSSPTTLSPAQLAEVSGLSSDMQRDWRRRGYITLGTQQANGRWLYDWYDAFHIFLMRRLYEDGCELVRANLFAATLLQDVLLHAVSIRYPGLTNPQYRFHRMQIDPRGQTEDGGWVSIRFNVIEDIEPAGFGMVSDCRQLAREILKSFNEAIEHLASIARGTVAMEDSP